MNLAIDSEDEPGQRRREARRRPEASVDRVLEGRLFDAAACPIPPLVASTPVFNHIPCVPRYHVIP